MPLPDARDWLPADDLAQFVVAAVDRVPRGSFAVGPIPGGTAQDHLRRLLARESGPLRLDTVASDGTELDADAFRLRPLREDRAKELRAKLAPTRQSNLTDPDSALMRRSDAHDYRHACTAQAVVCAEGSHLILATNLTACPSDAPGFATTILGMEQAIGLPKTVLGDAGFACGEAVAGLRASGIAPLVAISRSSARVSLLAETVADARLGPDSFAAGPSFRRRYRRADTACPPHAPAPQTAGRS